MTNIRSYAETMKIVHECERIEKEGGDVLGYIETAWPSYSPRATWYNIQKQYMNRRADQLTEGKPKDTKEVKAEAERRAKIHLPPPGGRGDKTEKNAAAAVKAIQEGRDVYHALEGMGYKNPSAQLFQLKKWAARHRPEWMPILQSASTGKGKYERKKKAGKPEVNYIMPIEAAEKEATAAEETEAANDGQTENGQPEDETDGKTEPAEDPEPDAANDGQMTGKQTEAPPDVYPMSGEKIEFVVRQIVSKTGIWEVDRLNGLIAFQARPEKGLPDGNMIRLPLEEWINMMAEIPTVMRVFGGRYT